MAKNSKKEKITRIAKDPAVERADAKLSDLKREWENAENEGKGVDESWYERLRELNPASLLDRPFPDSIQDEIGIQRLGESLDYGSQFMQLLADINREYLRAHRLTRAQVCMLMREYHREVARPPAQNARARHKAQRGSKRELSSWAVDLVRAVCNAKIIDAELKRKKRKRSKPARTPKPESS